MKNINKKYTTDDLIKLLFLIGFTLSKEAEDDPRYYYNYYEYVTKEYRYSIDIPKKKDIKRIEFNQYNIELKINAYYEYDDSVGALIRDIKNTFSYLLRKKEIEKLLSE